MMRRLLKAKATSTHTAMSPRASLRFAPQAVQHSTGVSSTSALRSTHDTGDAEESRRDGASDDPAFSPAVTSAGESTTTLHSCSCGCSARIARTIRFGLDHSLIDDGDITPTAVVLCCAMLCGRSGHLRIHACLHLNQTRAVWCFRKYNSSN